jgi:hypothetical protein
VTDCPYPLCHATQGKCHVGHMVLSKGDPHTVHGMHPLFAPPTACQHTCLTLGSYCTVVHVEFGASPVVPALHGLLQQPAAHSRTWPALFTNGSTLPLVIWQCAARSLQTLGGSSPEPAEHRQITASPLYSQPQRAKHSRITASPLCLRLVGNHNQQNTARSLQAEAFGKGTLCHQVTTSVSKLRLDQRVSTNSQPCTAAPQS